MTKMFPKLQRIALFVAFVGFVVGIVLSLRAQPDLLSGLNWLPLSLLCVFAIPVTIFLNALEFKLTGKLLSQDVSLPEATEITILAGVANMLPLPGGTIVRVAALKSGGASIRQGTTATLLVSLLWIGIAFLYAGLWVATSQGQLFGLAGIFLGIGALAVLACVFVAATQFDALDKFWPIIPIKLAHVIMDAARIWLCLLALGVEASFAQASALTVSSVVGAAVSIVPAGLGIREAAAAMLAPFILLTAASAYLAASLNRIVGLLMTAPVALFLAIRKKSDTS